MVRLLLLWGCSSTPVGKLLRVAYVCPLAHLTSPLPVPYFCSNAFGQIGWVSLIIRGSWCCRLLLFTKIFWQHPFCKLIFLCSPGNSLSFPPEPEGFSPGNVTVPRTGMMLSSCNGKSAECPGFEVLGELQQLACLSSVLSQFLSTLWSKHPVHVQSRRWKKEMPLNKNNILLKMELPFHIQLSWKRSELNGVRNICLCWELNVSLKAALRYPREKNVIGCICIYEHHHYYMVAQISVRGRGRKIRVLANSIASQSNARDLILWTALCLLLKGLQMSAHEENQQPLEYE